MDTQIRPISLEGWTKVDGVQPVRDSELIEVLYGDVNPDGYRVGIVHTVVYADEVDWAGRVIQSPSFWRYFGDYIV
ncbi:hypothetical protein GUH47_00025 [Xanthomonas citri pv. citri]|nr:hypothetical protein ART_00073 [Achromobacter phage vB_Ade_ART]MBD4204411.1 hypothetical protein [Xanthomonas citri pv. citri]